MPTIVTSSPTSDAQPQGQQDFDTLDTDTSEFLQRNGLLIHALATLSGHQILGLALGALAGSALRLATSTEVPKRRSGDGELQSLAEAGELALPVLSRWLMGLLADYSPEQAQHEAMSAFQAGALALGRQDSTVVPAALLSDVRLALRVSEAALHSRDWQTAAPSDEPAAVKSLVRYAESLPGEVSVRLPLADGKVSRVECIARVLRREGGYALLELDAVYDVETGWIGHAKERSMGTGAVTVVRESLVHGLSDAPRGVAVRLKLEAGFAGHVLTQHEAGEHPAFPGTAA